MNSDAQTPWTALWTFRLLDASFSFGVPAAVSQVGDGPGSLQRPGPHCPWSGFQTDWPHKVMTMTGHDTLSAENVEFLATVHSMEGVLVTTPIVPIGTREIDIVHA